jgi:hypothetical protein
VGVGLFDDKENKGYGRMVDSKVVSFLKQKKREIPLPQIRQD